MVRVARWVEESMLVQSPTNVGFILSPLEPREMEMSNTRKINPGLDRSSSLMKHISDESEAWRSGVESSDPESGFLKRKNPLLDHLGAGSEDDE